MADRGDETRDQVVVLDHDEWRRRGLAAGLREAEAAFAALNGVHAPGRDGLGGVNWDRVGAVLVGLDLPEAGWDRFGGLRLVEDVRRITGPTVTVVAWTAAADNPLVAVRAGEAGVDHLYAYDDFRDAEALARAVLSPAPDRVPRRTVNLAALQQVGLTFASRLTAGLDMIEAEGLAPFFAGAADHGLTRRRAITMRRRLAQLIGVRPVASMSGGVQQPAMPSWQQLRVLVTVARGADGR